MTHSTLDSASLERWAGSCFGAFTIIADLEARIIEAGSYLTPTALLEVSRLLPSLSHSPDEIAARVGWVNSYLEDPPEGRRVH